MFFNVSSSHRVTPGRRERQRETETEERRQGRERGWRERMNRER